MKNEFKLKNIMKTLLVEEQGDIVILYDKDEFIQKNREEQEKLNRYKIEYKKYLDDVKKYNVAKKEYTAPPQQHYKQTKQQLLNPKNGRKRVIVQYKGITDWDETQNRYYKNNNPDVTAIFDPNGFLNRGDALNTDKYEIFQGRGGGVWITGYIREPNAPIQPKPYVPIIYKYDDKYERYRPVSLWATAVKQAKKEGKDVNQIPIGKVDGETILFGQRNTIPPKIRQKYGVNYFD